MFMSGKQHSQAHASGHRPHRGFTLIELLVVVAIIAMLISILLPSLSRARGSARDLLCATKMHQISLAWQMYANDHAGTVMPCYHGWGNAQETWWVYKIEPYIMTQWNGGSSDSDWLEKLTCPVEGSIDRANNNPRLWIGMNDQLDPYYASATLTRPLPNLGSFTAPSRTVVFTDALWDKYSNLWAGSWIYRHKADTASNFAMADGHVEMAVAKAETGIDLRRPDGVVDAYPPEEFFYAPKSDTPGWPGLDYSRYKN